MNTEMARVIFNDYKTQTRRAITKLYEISLDEPKKHPISFKNAPKDLEFKNFHGFGNPCSLFYSKSKDKFYCGDNIKYKIGEEIWIREPAIVTNYTSRFNSVKIDYQLKSNDKKEYRIDLPSRFFPNPKKWITNCKSVPNGCIKEMAKTFVIIKGARVERLQRITFNDALAEGIEIRNTSELIKNDMLELSQMLSSNNLRAIEIAIKNSFIEIWDSTAPKGCKWKDNPLVIIYDFKRVKHDKR